MSTTRTDPIAAVLAIAKSQVGYYEKHSNATVDQLYNFTDATGDDNYTKYARDLCNSSATFNTKYGINGNAYNGNKQGVYWCAMYVDWCFIKCFGYDAMKAMTFHPNGMGASCTSNAAQYIANNRFFQDPQPGDEIFYGTSTSDCYHTGIVYAVDASYVYTYEGNTSDDNNLNNNGGCVWTKTTSLSSTRIVGYGRPDWSKAGTNFTPPDADDEDSGNVTPDPPTPPAPPTPPPPVNTINAAISCLTKTSISICITSTMKVNKVVFRINGSTVTAQAMSSNTDFKAYYLINISGLTPNTANNLTVTFDGTQSVVLPFRTLLPDMPSVGSITSQTSATNRLPENTYQIRFSKISNWGYWESFNRGYSVYVIKNGKALLNSSNSKPLELFNFSVNDGCPSGLSSNSNSYYFNFIPANYGFSQKDSFQIGIQTWAKDSRGNILSVDAPFPKCSNVTYLNFINSRSRAYLKTSNGFSSIELFQVNT